MNGHVTRLTVLIVISVRLCSVNVKSGGIQRSRGKAAGVKFSASTEWKGATLAPAAAVTAASQCATDPSRSGSPKRPMERKVSQQSMVLDVAIGGSLNSTGITENHREHKWRSSVRLERADDRSLWPCANLRRACQGASCPAAMFAPSLRRVFSVLFVQPSWFSLSAIW